jgi:hypothetical protein
MRVAVFGTGISRAAGVLLGAVVLAGCGSHARRAVPPAEPPATTSPHVPRCASGATRSLGSARVAYLGFAPHGAVAVDRPGGRVVARFGRTNVNGYPTLFAVLGERGCDVRWYRVQLPIRPNGASGWIRAGALQLQTVRTRIVVDLSQRSLTLYRNGVRVLSATVAVGSPATPTPLGRYYVNQRLVPDDPNGPYGPGAIGISAFSPVLTGWAQGGPVAIHGTNEPWSIGHAVSNGCIRVPNAVLRKLWPLTPAGTPVQINS